MATLGNLGTMSVRDKHGNMVPVPVIRGDDGGYYIPSVDEGGTLRWVPSTKGMVDIPSANIRGPAGTKVEIGENENWWLDGVDTGVATGGTVIQETRDPTNADKAQTGRLWLNTISGELWNCSAGDSNGIAAEKYKWESLSFRTGVENFYLTYTTNMEGDFSYISDYTINLTLKNGERYALVLPNTVPISIQTGQGAPTGELPGTGNSPPLYFDKLNRQMYVCTGYAGILYGFNWVRTEGRKITSSGETDPTTDTAGEKDDIYVNLTTGAVFICTGYRYVATGTEYLWQKVGGTGGGSITAIPDGDVLELVITGAAVSTDGD